MSPSEDLLQQMKTNAGPFPTGGWYGRTDFGISYQGSMTNGGSAELTVYVDTTTYNYNAGPSYNAWCHFELIVGSFLYSYLYLLWSVYDLSKLLIMKSFFKLMHAMAKRKQAIKNVQLLIIPSWIFTSRKPGKFVLSC